MGQVSDVSCPDSLVLFAKWGWVNVVSSCIMGLFWDAKRSFLLGNTSNIGEPEKTLFSATHTQDNLKWGLFPFNMS